MAMLYVDQGELQGDFIYLLQDKLVLGRSPDCDEVISKNDAVSRRHAVIHKIDGAFYIEDLQTRGGTYVNDQAHTADDAVVISSSRLFWEIAIRFWSRDLVADVRAGLPLTVKVFRRDACDKLRKRSLFA
jgi:hypothetical protein